MKIEENNDCIFQKIFYFPINKSKEDGINNFNLKLFIVFLLLCLPINTSSSSTVSQEENKNQKILVINSYHPGYKWSDDIMLGIRDVISKQNGVELIIEYLDTKRHFKKPYLQKFEELFRHKYKDTNIDLLITSDDNALDFAMGIKKELFPGIPLVFCGIDHINPERIANQESVYGIVEADSTRSTIDLILSIHPDIKSVTFIADETSTGKLMIERTRKLESTFQKNVHFNYIIDVSIEELQLTLEDIPENSVIFYLSFIRDKNGKVFSIEKSMKLIAKSANVPVYCSWGFQSNTGIMGGNILSGYKQGEISAEVAWRLLVNDSVESIPAIQQASLVYKFDYQALDRFNIDESKIPENSIIYNKPFSFFKEYKTLIVITLLIGLSLVLFIMLLFLNITRRKRAEAELQKSHDHLDQKVNIRTAELLESNKLLNKEITERKQATDALSAKEIFLNRIIDQSPYATWISDAEGTLQRANPALKKFLNLTDEQLVGKYNVLNDKIAEKQGLQPIFQTVFKEGKTITFSLEWDGNDMPNVDLKGSNSVCVEGTMFPIHNSEGILTNVVLNWIDITKRKRAEVSLIESEEKHRAIIENLSDLILILDKDGINVWNSPAVRQYGLEPEVSIGRPFDEYVHPDDLESVRKLWNEAIADPGKTYFSEYRTSRTPENPDTWIYQHATFTYLPDTAGINGVVSVCRNETERKRAEMALRESDEKWRSLTENSPDHIMLIDLDYHIQFINYTVPDLTIDEVIGKSCLNFVPPDQRQVMIECHNRVIQSGKSDQYEIMYINIEEEKQYFDVRVAPLTGSDGAVNGLISTSNNVTERKKMDIHLQQAQKIDAIGTLAGGIAHDFNNMLGIITGNISYVLSILNKEDELYQILSDVQESSKQAQNLTHQLLTFSKGGSPIKKVANINKLIKESAIFSTRGAKADCSFELQDNLWLSEVDEGQINQAIGNLVINANQAMPNGGTIKIRTENEDIDTENWFNISSGRYIKIIVEDQGVGISEKHLQNIFDPYFTTKQKGSGLGLTTTYSIIKKHGGHITVDSEIEKGTTFNIYLPASSIVLKKTADKEEVKHEGKGKILIMDDQEPNLKMVDRMISRMGYDNVSATNGSQAIEYFRDAYQSGNPFDLVILDLTVPGGMGGAKTIPELLKIDPKVKAVVSSGYSNDPIMANYEDYGFCGVVPKPYTMDQMAELLNRIFGEKE